MTKPKKEGWVGVVGLGYAGLPLVMHLLRHDMSVVGVDTDREKIEALERGESYIPDVNGAELASYAPDKWFATTDYTELRRVGTILFCLPTEMDADGAPDLSMLLDGIRSAAPMVQTGSLVIIESTVYPGATRGIIEDTLFDSCRHPDYYLAYSPERVDPGNSGYDLGDIPKLVGGIDEESTRVATKFYRKSFDKIVSLTAEEAEFAKLAENSFRLVNIALANEWAMLAHALDIDIWKVIDAAATKPFGFMPFYPGPGVGGHCIPVNPSYLSWLGKGHGAEQILISDAQEINEYAPVNIANRLAIGMGRALPGAKVLIVGLAYKPDLPDTRHSPGVALARILQRLGAVVSYHDPYVHTYPLGGDVKWRSLPIGADTVADQDAVVLVTGHLLLDYHLICKSAKYVLDTRNILRGIRDAYSNVELL